MDNTIFELIGKILAAFVVGIVAYLAPRVKSWLDAHVEKVTSERIMSFVQSFVQAADQLFKENDPTGEKRHAYVVEQLEALGITVTEAVLAMIEGAVWEVNAFGGEAQ